MRRGTRAPGRRLPVRCGFTLVEVVMALLVLEIGVLGALGMLTLASRTLRRAERLERATGRVEALLDSLGRGASPDTVSFRYEDVGLTWTLDGRGRLEVVATDEDGGLLVRAQSTVRIR